MKARLLLDERHQLRVDAFVEVRVWETPGPVRGSEHRLKYALAYVVEGVCVLRYDNEAAKAIIGILAGPRPLNDSRRLSNC